MNEIIDQLDSEEIGARLRRARENAKLTQAAVARTLKVARTTLVAIEQGQRRARLSELQQLARLYKTSVNALLREQSVHLDLKPRFRKAGEVHGDVEASVDLLTHLLRAEIELENLLGVRRTRNDPPERPLQPGDVAMQAELDAHDLRQWLGIGPAPIHYLEALLELQLGVRIFVRKLPSNVSGLYVFDETFGPCFLLNAFHSRERRAQTAAHELGHFISTRRSPDALLDDSSEARRDERYANVFGRAFLTPARTVTAKFKEVTAGARHLTRRHIIILAHIFGVSREAMVRRLEELGLAKPSAWEWFVANGGITREQVQEVLGESAKRDLESAMAEKAVPIRLGALASEAWRGELMSEGQIARLLDLDRVEVRKVLDDYETEGGAADASLRHSD